MTKGINKNRLPNNIYLAVTCVNRNIVIVLSDHRKI